MSTLAKRWQGQPTYLSSRRADWCGLLTVAAEVRNECRLPEIDHIFEDSGCGWPLINVHKSSLRASSALQRVRPVSANATRDLGEDISLALLMSDLLTLRWVTLDVRAERRTLHELGAERVCSPYDLLIDLLERGLLDLAAFDACKKAFEARMQGLLGFPARLQPRYNALKGTSAGPR
ncbi:hypothetical protein L6R49_03665 [Myxococcota bacterium]|nr:hypothetical protein [Myxococcota bacterium]